MKSISRSISTILASALVLVFAQACVSNNGNSPAPNTPAPGSGHRPGPKPAYNPITVVKAATSLSASNIANERARRMAARKPKIVQVDDNNVYVGEDFYLRLSIDSGSASMTCKAFEAETVYGESGWKLVQGMELNSTYLVATSGYFFGTGSKTVSANPCQLRVQVKEEFRTEGKKQILFSIARKDTDGTTIYAGSMVVNVK